MNVRSDPTRRECLSYSGLVGRLAIWLSCLWLSGSLQALHAADVTYDAGWKQLVRLGRWNVATVTTTADASGKYRLTCQAPDPEGHLAVFESAEISFAAGDPLRIEVPYLLGRPDGQLRMTLLQDDQVLWHHVVRFGASTETPQPLVLGDWLILTHGEIRGFDALNSPIGSPEKAGVQVVDWDTNVDLPAALLAYDAIDILVLAGTTAPSESARAAIQRWVQGGGRLIVSLPMSSDNWQTSPLREWLPVTIPPEYVTARGLGDLEAFAGRNIRIPYVNRLEIPQLPSSPGLVLANSRENPLLLRTPWGFGEVLVVAVDLTQPPLSNWGGLDDFLHKLLAATATSTASQKSDREVNRPLTSSGITDLASQLMAAQDHFPAVHRPAPWWSMAWLLILIAVVGPLDYLLVHRVLQRPRWTWWTLPLWLTAATAFAAFTSESWNASPITTRQLDIVDVDVAANIARSETWITTLAPDSSRLSIAIQPTADEWDSLWVTNHTTRQPMRWRGIPETTTGGIYRPSGSEWGRASYQIATDQTEIQELPVLKWSTRTLSTGWSSEASQLIESNLRNTGLGRITGEVTHHLPGTLTDWMLVYGSRVYRQYPSRDAAEVQPWEPGARFSTDDPRILQNDLKNILTQMVITRETEMGKPKEQRLRYEQTRYDVLDRSTERLWQILTFHEAIGGQTYTGLTNTSLDTHDFSRQLDLGRAVLFGRLKSKPTAAVTMNGQTTPTEDSVVFVRVVLPVQTANEVLRVLPKLGNAQDETE